jgi:hypothetical protein
MGMNFLQPPAGAEGVADFGSNVDLYAQSIREMLA